MSIQNSISNNSWIILYITVKLILYNLGNEFTQKQYYYPETIIQKSRYIIYHYDRLILPQWNAMSTSSEKNWFIRNDYLLLSVVSALFVLQSCLKDETPIGTVNDYQYEIPQQTSDGWPTASLASVGIAEQPLLDLLNKLQHTPDHRRHPPLRPQPSALSPREGIENAMETGKFQVRRTPGALRGPDHTRWKLASTSRRGKRAHRGDPGAVPGGRGTECPSHRSPRRARFPQGRGTECPSHRVMLPWSDPPGNRWW